MKNMRKSRFFQSDAYISVDFLEKTTEILRLENVPDPDKADALAMLIDLGKGKGTKQIIFEKPEIKPVNAIKTELESFAQAIKENKTPLVSIEDGYAALDVAYKIMDKMNYKGN